MKVEIEPTAAAQSDKTSESAPGPEQPTFIDPVPNSRVGRNPVAMAIFESGFRFALALVDLFILVGSYWCALLGYQHLLGRELPPLMREPLLVAAAAAGLYVTLFALFGLYRLDQGFLNLHNTRRSIKGFAVATVVLLASTFFIRSTHFSRLAISFGIALSALLVPVGRAFVFRLGERARYRRFGNLRVLIVGDGELGLAVLRNLLFSSGAARKAVGFVTENIDRVGQPVTMRTGTAELEIPILGGMDSVSTLIKVHGVDEIIVAHGTQSVDELLMLQRDAMEANVRVLYLPHIYPLFWHNLSVFNVGRLPLLGFHRTGEEHIYLLTKRAFDLVSSALALLVLSPILFLVGVIIKVESRGPVLFKQERIGKQADPFVLFKFRTMRVDAPKYALHPTDSDDPRITRVGKWLRRTSIDELPQLWNVLRGDMSVVGPRPEMQFVVEEYNENQRARLRVRPGITGVWQISPERSLPIHEGVDYDLYYIENRSFALDLAIILRTVFSLIRGRGT